MNILRRIDAEKSQMERALARLEDALDRCRREDVRYGLGISAALSFLEQRATEKWPFEQFRKALEDFSTDGVNAEGRWQILNASLNGIRRVVQRTD